jgi:hypothetical protein
MTSDLSIFAARLREFIGICADEFASGSQNLEPAFLTHADAEFHGMSLVLFALQFTHNPAYRRFCEARNVSPRSVTHWTQIPAVPTSAFKELELTSLRTEQRTHIFHSSGTTGQQPSRHFHNAGSLTVYETSLLAWFRRRVLPELKSEISNLNLVILTPPPALAPHSSLAHMFETARRDLGAPEAAFAGGVTADRTWTLDFHAVQAALTESANRKRPLLLLGTAFSFVHLLDFLAENNLRFDLPRGSRVMETGGYKNRSRALPKAELHALITERLGILPTEIICEYGMSELSSQAYDSDITHESSRVFHFPPWARAQIISPETSREVAEGETGLLRIFDLANVFSVMAIQTEDLAIRRGAAFELVGRTEFSEPRGCSLMSNNA